MENVKGKYPGGSDGEDVVAFRIHSVSSESASRDFRDFSGVRRIRDIIHIQCSDVS